MKKLVSILGLSAIAGTAVADGLGQAPAQGSSLPSILMLVVMVAIFYFLLIRPQMRKTKEQRELISSLEKGDEVVTTSGIFGKISKVEDTFVILSIANGVEIRIQKQAIISMLPKGSLEA
ncbi:MAG: preprotein translocase subunit YajC [Gammaproteobacteria bacterium]|jgi:preprotein translocase subunit YajC|nr:preprotein translocase subunit YajC [Gammaproteobacteria bacterium]